MFKGIFDIVKAGVRVAFGKERGGLLRVADAAGKIDKIAIIAIIVRTVVPILAFGLALLIAKLAGITVNEVLEGAKNVQDLFG